MTARRQHKRVPFVRHPACTDGRRARQQRSSCCSACIVVCRGLPLRGSGLAQTLSSATRASRPTGPSCAARSSASHTVRYRCAYIGGDTTQSAGLSSEVRGIAHDCAELLRTWPPRLRECTRRPLRACPLHISASQGTVKGYPADLHVWLRLQPPLADSTNSTTLVKGFALLQPRRVGYGIPQRPGSPQIQQSRVVRHLGQVYLRRVQASQRRSRYEGAHTHTHTHTRAMQVGIHWSRVPLVRHTAWSAREVPPRHTHVLVLGVRAMGRTDTITGRQYVLGSRGRLSLSLCVPMCVCIFCACLT